MVHLLFFFAMFFYVVTTYFWLKNNKKLLYKKCFSFGNHHEYYCEPLTEICVDNTCTYSQFAHFLLNSYPRCSLSYCMQVEITMSQTSLSHPGISLIPIILGDARDERVFLLLQIEGKNEGIDHLRDEVVNILTHAILDADGGVYERA